MDMYRAFLAIIISFVILVGYQFLFVKPPVDQPLSEQQAQQEAPAQDQNVGSDASVATLEHAASIPPSQEVKIDQSARDITIDTPLYTAVINEQGGGFKGFLLKGYREENEPDSTLMQLVQTDLPTELPFLFSLGSDIGQGLPVFRSEKEKMIDFFRLKDRVPELFFLLPVLLHESKT